MDLLILIKKKLSFFKKLEIVIEENNIKEFKEVLESGEVDLNIEIQKYGGNCVVYIVAYKGLFFCVEILLEYGVDFDKINYFNLIFFYIVFRRNYVKCVEIFLRVNRVFMSIDSVWMQMDNVQRVWNDVKDIMICVLVKVILNLMRCRSNIRSNLFFLCKNKSMYGSLRVMIIVGYKFSDEEKIYFMKLFVEGDKFFYEWLDNY